MAEGETLTNRRTNYKTNITLLSFFRSCLGFRPVELSIDLQRALCSDEIITIIKRCILQLQFVTYEQTEYY